ncbi:MAG: V-type ATP synthase subunit D, partial [Gallicola sp.]|nr:V-type ATP synthase subunit D [Gallicola sp.]
MAKLNVNPTRMQLSMLKTRLKTATRGHKLLKDKQDELVRRFIELVRKNKELRENVEHELTSSFIDFTMASATTVPNFLELALSLPKQKVYLDLKKKNVMSVEIPVMSF